MKLPWGTFGLIAGALAGILLLFVVPAFVATFTLVNLTLYAAMAILAMSLALVWGYGGILSLGQAVFFGLGGYAYAIAVINMGDSTLPALLAIIVPMIFAALLGYFMFWGRISDVYLAVITLTVSLIFYLLINSMSGSEYRIGMARIGGYNGIPGLPPLNMPGNPAQALGFEAMYYVTVVAAIAVYFGLRWLLASRFGRVVVSIRENEVRTELLGYDARKYKLAIYVIGAGLAGLSGMLFSTWGGLINPDVFGMAFAAQTIVWVMFGGLGTLLGPVIGSVVIQMLVLWLGAVKIADVNMVLGAVFVLFVLLVPAGLLPKLRSLAEAAVGRDASERRSAQAAERHS